MTKIASPRARNSAEYLDIQRDFKDDSLIYIAAVLNNTSNSPSPTQNSQTQSCSRLIFLTQRSLLFVEMSILIKPSSISNATTAAAKTLSHLLIAGNNCLSPPSEYASRSQQAPSNAILTVIPFALWLGSIGRANDVDAGWHLSRSGLGAGFGHTIITYTSGTAGVDRIFAAGRNESGQLGIGYNSQEGTRNLIQGFNGEGIVQTAAGLQSSYILVKHQGRSSSSLTYVTLLMVCDGEESRGKEENNRN